jgi:integrase/recombinase XerD
MLLVKCLNDLPLNRGKTAMNDSLTAPSFPTLLQRFFADHLTRHRAVSPRTIAAYRDTFRLLLLFVEKHIGKSPTAVALTDLQSEVVLAFLDHLERDRANSSRSRNARLAAIRSFLRYAAHHDITALPVIQRTLAVPMKRCDKPLLGFLSREEMQAIIEAPDASSWTGRRDRALFTVMYNTGARVSEIIALRASDVILDGSLCAHIQGKGRKQRSIPLWRKTASILRAWKRELGDIPQTASIFPNRDGGAMTRSNVTQRLALHVKAATKRSPQLVNRQVSPHTFRHTTAMHLLQSGIDITVIALWLGHESTTTTHMYVEADLSMKERALGRLEPVRGAVSRYKPPDALMQFLQAL